MEVVQAKMATTTTLALLTCFYVSIHFRHSYSSSSRHSIGVHPLDVKYYDSELIKCKDGSKSFTRDRLNDDFCDCADGTDEPGTSACPASKFYCRNTGSTPKFLFSSRVNDQICDCCDGSDEYDGAVTCHNTCIMGGNIVYQKVKYDPESNLGSVNSRKTKPGIKTEDSSQKLKGLKGLVFLQVGLVISVMGFCLFRKRKPKRRQLSKVLHFGSGRWNLFATITYGVNSAAKKPIEEHSIHDLKEDDLKEVVASHAEYRI